MTDSEKWVDLTEMYFYRQTREVGQISENRFTTQNEPYTANLRFSGVLKHFGPKLIKKLSFRSKK